MILIVIGVVSQTRVSGGNRTHDTHTNSLAHYPLDYQDTHIKFLFLINFLMYMKVVYYIFSFFFFKGYL